MVVLHGSFDKTEHRLVYMALATLWKHATFIVIFERVIGVCSS